MTLYFARLTRIVLCATVFFALITPAVAQLDFTMEVSTQTDFYDPETGEGVFTISITLAESPENDGFPNDVQGFQGAFEFDESRIAIVNYGSGEIYDGIGFTGFSVDAVPGGLTFYGLHYIFNPDFQFEEPTEIVWITFETVAGEFADDETGVTLPLEWAVLGSPQYYSAVISEGADYAPIEVDGAVTLLPGVDCNLNDIDDATDVADGTSSDCNENGVPDECEIDFGNRVDLAPADADGEFGASVALLDGVLAVGNPLGTGETEETGTVTIYRHVDGEWIEEQVLQSPEGQTGERFGAAVSLFGDRVVVGAPNRDRHAGAIDTGAVYVYRWEPTLEEWAFEQELFWTASSDEDHLGGAVAIHQGRIVVGAAGEDQGGSDTGAIHVFEWNADEATWERTARVVADDRDPEDRFGSAVDLFDDWIAVGASGDDEGATDAGALYLLTPDATGSWDQEEKFVLTSINRRFGTSVDFTDGAIAAGGSGGGVRVYRFDGTAWNEELVPTATIGSTGHAVALHGPHLLVSSPRLSENGVGSFIGMVRRYFFDGTEWLFVDEVRGDVGEMELGGSIALSSSVTVAGAFGVAPGLVRIRVNGDCNDNGVPDSCDLADGTEADLDGDGFIDACRAFPLADLFRRGDINGNGTVDPLIDAIALLEWVFVDGPAPPCSDAADVDDNGSNATLTDVIALVEWGFQNGPPPPAPGPTDCGPDPTDDLLECEELPTCP